MPIWIRTTLIAAVVTMATAGFGADQAMRQSQEPQRPTLENGDMKADCHGQGGRFNVWNNAIPNATPMWFSGNKIPIGNGDGIVLDPYGNCYLRIGGKIYGLKSGAAGEVIRPPGYQPGPPQPTLTARLFLDDSGQLTLEYDDQGTWVTYCEIYKP